MCETTNFVLICLSSDLNIHKVNYTLTRENKCQAALKFQRHLAGHPACKGILPTRKTESGFLVRLWNIILVTIITRVKM